MTGTDYLDGLEGGRARAGSIAFSPTMGGHPVEPGDRQAGRPAAQVFRELGATVEEVDPEIGPDVRPDLRQSLVPRCGQRAARLQRRSSGKVMDPGLREIAAAGAKLPLMDYLAAVKEREQLGVRMNMFHETWDLLLTPTLPLAAFAAGDRSARSWPTAAAGPIGRRSPTPST